MPCTPQPAPCMGCPESTGKRAIGLRAYSHGVRRRQTHAFTPVSSKTTALEYRQRNGTPHCMRKNDLDVKIPALHKLGANQRVPAVYTQMSLMRVMFQLT